MKPTPPNKEQDMVAVRVEVSPGKVATMNLPRHKIGKFGLTKIILTADGTPQIVWKSWHTKVRITRDLPRQLGLPVDVETLRCLYNAGIVKGTKFSPAVTMIDLDSLAEHLEAASGEKAREYWAGWRSEAYGEAWKEKHLGQTNRPPRRHKASKKPAPPPPQTRRATPAPPPAPKKPPGPPHPELFHL